MLRIVGIDNFVASMELLIGENWLNLNANGLSQQRVVFKIQKL